jgi:hypothetical protein
MKVHYNNALRPDRFVVCSCGIASDLLPATVDPALVTCKNCLKRMGTPTRPDPYPVYPVVFMFGNTVRPWGAKRK